MLKQQLIPAELLMAQDDVLPSVETSRPIAPAPRLHFVDGLRGLAMLSVLLYHCWMYGGQWHLFVSLGARTLDLAACLGYGHVGVNLFLVLSGFCLYWPFTRVGRAEPTLWAFAKKRCRRILPPYYAALLLFWLFLLADVVTHHHYHEDATTVPHVALSLMWHLAMLHNLSPDYILSINGVFWSLALEFSLYILFPALVEGFRRFGPWLPAAAALAVDLSWRHAAASAIGPQTPVADSFVLTNSLPGRCFEFTAGMVAAWAMARLVRETPAESRLLVSRACLGVSLVSGAAAVWVTERYGDGSTFPDALWGLCFAALVVAAVHPASLLHRGLSHPLLVKLGIFSYSVYLIHLPLTKALDAVILHHHLPAALLGVCVIAPLMLLLGYGFHLVFERPFMTAPSSRPV
jgi:peptidoglycan/LPS O-acetylase OafA/YrhL